MTNGVIVEVKSPVTQTTEAVVSLLKYIGKPFDPLPQAVSLPGAVLVLSAKKDVYYTTTPKNCSCPSKTWRPGQSCKHMRRYFPRTNDTLARATAGEDATSIKPTGKWANRLNGPFLEED